MVVGDGERIGWWRTASGPARTRRESVVGTCGLILGIALLALYVKRTGGWDGLSVPQAVFLVVAVVDIPGGMFMSSSLTASRWYHRAGSDARRFRILFVLAQVPFLALPAALFDVGWVWALANIGLLLGLAAAIEYAPGEMKRLVALAVTLTAVLVNLIWLPAPSSLTWLPILLFVKVLGCFLVPVDPTSPNRSDTNVSAEVLGR
jgi:hypothetical protein